jgi:glycosyltransferase involved in cell wall biosynthesis
MAPQTRHLPGLHVLLIAPYGPSGGGMGRCMEYLADAAPPGISIRKIDSRGQGHAIVSVLSLLRAALHIAASALSRRPTVVHLNMAEGGSVLRKGLLLHLSRALGLPTVLHLHAARFVPFYHALPGFWRRRVDRIFRLADVVVVLGQAQADWVAQNANLPRSRIRIVPNGVRAPPAAPPQNRQPGFHFLFLGNLVPRKGVDDLLHALASPDFAPYPWRLTMAGGGESGRLRHLADALGIGDRVRLTGWVSRTEADTLLRQADALVLPSHDEALPLVVLEALAAALPVIATSVGNLPEILDPETAILLPPGDRAALTRAALTFLRHPEYAARLGRAGRDLYERAFTVDLFVTRLCAIYRDILPGRGFSTRPNRVNERVQHAPPTER